ncbi:MAG TPA: excinuclease ABC subunit UvrA, partial [Bdellovibrionota bacterium]|nr:excinuclease ABC subunit UvrA [Bdellovibrionota bacterium]
ANTLSGGEAQRLKIARELSSEKKKKQIYLLDEPTTGLHPHDISLLLKVLNDLVEEGHSVVIIEHNLDVIRSADWIIDLGPEGGDEGGWIIAEGTPAQVAKIRGSYTGQFLARH